MGIAAGSGASRVGTRKWPKAATTQCVLLQEAHPLRSEPISEAFEQLSFDGAIGVLRGWIDRDVNVILGPVDQPGADGRAWAKLTGCLRASDRGNAWSSARGADAAIAFQVGESQDGYFVLYPDLFLSGYWVSRDHSFLVLRMVGMEVGIEAG